MKFLITGAGGFIGWNLASALADDGHAVVAITRQRDVEFPRGVSGVTADISKSSEALAEFLGDEVYVIHAAGHTHLIKNSTDEDFNLGNITTTENVMSAISRQGASGLLYFSTLSVYGQISDPILTVQTLPDRPESYGRSKLAAEKLVEIAKVAVPRTIVRLPGVLGPDNYWPWLGRITGQAKRGEVIQIYNGSAFFNNVTDIRDLSRLAVHLASGDVGIGQRVVNLAARDPLTIRDVVDEILEGLGAKLQVIEQPAQASSFSIDITPLQEQLKFDPRTTRDMVRDYIKDCC